MTESARGRPVAIVDDPIFDEHHARGEHPERPERLAAARRAVARFEGAGGAVVRPAVRDATEDEIAWAHSAAYAEQLAALAGKQTMLDADTFIAPHSVAAARRAAGASIALVDAILSENEGDPRTGLALLRPPGHHATRGHGMGFCLLDNVAIAAYRALDRGLSRVAIVDFDVHHGNGTQDIFEGDPRVLFVSLHEWPLYPGTGAVTEVGSGDGAGYTVNVPLSGGAGDAVYEASFEAIVEPALARFEPELVLVSAGYDAHKRDPLGGMCVTNEGYAAMVRSLSRVAGASAEGRIALLLEGGYDLQAIEEALLASLEAMTSRAGEPEARAPESIGSRHREEIDRARKVASKRWGSL